MTGPAQPASLPEGAPGWFVKLGAVGVINQSSSEPLCAAPGQRRRPRPGGRAHRRLRARTAFDGQQRQLSNLFTIVGILGYFVTPTVSIEAATGVPTWEKVRITGFTPGAPAAGTLLFEALPATAPITAVYHFRQLGALQPYLGVGVAPVFTLSTRSEFSTGISVDPTAGLVLQGGFDYMFNPDWGSSLTQRRSLRSSTSRRARSISGRRLAGSRRLRRAGPPRSLAPVVGGHIPLLTGRQRSAPDSAPRPAFWTRPRSGAAPLNHAAGAAVTLMDRSNVSTVLCAGQIKKWRGAIVGHDIPKLRAELEASRDHVFRSRPPASSGTCSGLKPGAKGHAAHSLLDRRSGATATPMGLDRLRGDFSCTGIATGFVAMIAERYKLEGESSEHAVAQYVGLDRSDRFGGRGRRRERALLDPSGTSCGGTLPGRGPVAGASFEPKPPNRLPWLPLICPDPAPAPGAERLPNPPPSPTRRRPSRRRRRRPRPARAPAFDMVNVDPSGEAVIAGRAAPNAKVELRDAGKTVAEATADASGQFVIIPPALAPGDHSLSLGRERRRRPAGDIKPGRGLGSRAAGQGAPCRPARPKPIPRGRRLPANPKAAPSAFGMRTLATPAPASGARVAIQSVEADAAGGLFAKGSAEPNATRAPLSQSGRPRRGQDAIRRPLVVDDPARHEPRRLCHAGRRDQSERCDASSRAPIRHSTIQMCPRPTSPAAADRGFRERRAIVRALARRPGRRIDSNQAGRHWAHLVGAQPKLLRRPDALPGDCRSEPGADPQSQCHLSRPGVRRPEVGRRNLVGAMPPDRRDETLPELRHRTFDDALGRRIVDTHIWAVREGLRGADAYHLFDGYCQRLVIDGIAAVAGACGDGDAASAVERLWLHLAARSQRHRARELRPWRRGMSRSGSRAPSTRSCSAPAPARTTPACAGASRHGPEERDFPILEEFFALGATDYLAQLFVYGEMGDRSQGTGIVYSFTTDRKGGFSDDDTTLVQATLPALVAGDEGPCRPCHRLGPARRLSRRGRRSGASMPARSCAVRSTICAPCSGTRTSAASRRSATRRRVPSSSNCSTKCSRS